MSRNPGLSWTFQDSWSILCVMCPWTWGKGGGGGWGEGGGGTKTFSCMMHAEGLSYSCLCTKGEPVGFPMET